MTCACKSHFGHAKHAFNCISMKLKYFQKMQQKWKYVQNATKKHDPRRFLNEEKDKKIPPNF